MNHAGDRKREADFLVPFVVNGTASAEERDLVEDEAGTDEELARETHLAAQIRAAMQARPHLHSPGELGLARLKRDLRSSAPAVQSAQAAATTRDAAWWRRAAVAAMAACFTLAVIGIVRPPQSGPGYELVGSQTGELAGAAAFQVTFVPTASEAEIRAVLNDLGLEITSGPGALGVYGLSPAEEGRDDRALLARLRAATTVVDSAASVGAR